MPYDTAIIRKLIGDSFTSDEFEVFCQDYFNEVYKNFTTGERQIKRITSLIAYADKDDQFDYLLQKLKEVNPYQYKNYESKLNTQRSSEVTSKSNENKPAQSLDISNIEHEELKESIKSNGKILIDYTAMSRPNRKLAEFFIRSFRNIFSRFHKKYIEQLKRDYSRMSLSELNMIELYLEQVYVEPLLGYYNYWQKSVNSVNDINFTDGQTVWSYLRELKKQETTALVIVGPAGCGKTSILNNIIITFASKKQFKHKLPSRIPIPLLLGKYAKTIAEKNISLGELAQMHFSDIESYNDLNPPSNWFPRCLQRGKCLILLDELDEVNPEYRKKVVCWLEHQIRNYNKCQFQDS
ncbi:NACHT NTPase domain-containing protein [Desulfonema limicola]|uniref:NACHT NTPase domain-containing protein n=1 Tax=Desulfonema limicola TaxID=45656 RepID=A0A975B4N6_9BACT|nr:NACHT domain-containing protein [Desulfonema limicola]QTA78724.1 NACHT NTPase domain-containing protein [Desulfonema limicola]